MLLQEYKEKMRAHLLTEKGLDSDRNRISMALRGMNGRFDTLTMQLKEETKLLATTMKEHINTEIQKGKQEFRKNIADALQTTALTMTQEEDGEEEEELTKKSAAAAASVTIAAVVGTEPSSTIEQFGYRMTTIFANLPIVSVYNEYYGFGRYEGLPIEGGIHAMEQKYKTKWRSNYSSAEQKQFSRVTLIMKAITKRTEEDKEDLDYVLADLSQYYSKDGKYSLALLVEVCQDHGWLTKRKRKRDGNDD